MKLKDKTTDALVKEIKKLRKDVRTWQKISAWDSMATHYGSHCSQVNMGDRPKEPRHI